MPPLGPAHIPLVAHVIFRLDIGGLENGVVNLVNNLPEDCYRHAIICLTDFTEFRKRIRRSNVDFYRLNKRPGQDWKVYFRLWRLFRKIRPALLHTRNLAGLEAQFPGFLARIPHRVHSEHGRDLDDLEGKKPQYTLLRRWMRPLVDTYVPLSRDLESWLKNSIRVPERKIVQIYNGVDTKRFHPAAERHAANVPKEMASPDSFVIGTVGRLQPIKDQLTLARAFLRFRELRPDMRKRARLVVVGDGETKPDLMRLLESANALDSAWIPGARDDVDEILRRFDVFVLPSISEGICNCILEAMATGLPVVATQVGGNPELVLDRITGRLVPAQQPDAMARAIADYADSPEEVRQHGTAGRKRCEEIFSIDRMAQEYAAVYNSLLSGAGRRLPCQTITVPKS